MIGLYKAFTDAIGENEYKAEYKRLPEHVRQHIDSRGTDEAKKRSLLGNMLLRRGIEELFGEREYSVEYGKNGKPMLPFCQFSIAHTDTLVVCAFSHTRVGVDAERMRRVYKGKRFPLFTERETEYIKRSEIGRDRRFLELWTRKEAYVKMIGGSMSRDGGIDVLEEVPGCNFSDIRFDEYIVMICEEC